MTDPSVPPSVLHGFRAVVAQDQRLLAFYDRQRQEWAYERAGLMNRIQELQNALASEQKCTLKAAENAVLMNRIEEIQRALESERSRTRTAIEKLKSAETVVNSLQSRHRQEVELAAQRENLQSKLIQANADLKIMQSGNASLARENQGLRSENQGLTSEVQALRTEVQALRESNRVAQLAVQKAQASAQDARAASDVLENRLNVVLAEKNEVIDSKLVEMQRALDQCRRDAADLQRKYADASNRNQSLLNAWQQQAIELQSVRSTNDVLQQRLNEPKMSCLDDAAKLDAEMKETQLNLDSAKKALTDSEQKLEQMTLSKADVEKSAEIKIKSLVDQTVALNQQLRIEGQKVQDAIRRETENIARASKLESELQEMRARFLRNEAFETCKKALDNEMGRSKGLSDKINAQVTTITELTDKNTIANAKLDELRIRLQDVVAEFDVKTHQAMFYEHLLMRRVIRPTTWEQTPSVNELQRSFQKQDELRSELVFLASYLRQEVLHASFDTKQDDYVNTDVVNVPLPTDTLEDAQNKAVYWEKQYERRVKGVNIKIKQLLSDANQAKSQLDEFKTAFQRHRDAQAKQFETDKATEVLQLTIDGLRAELQSENKRRDQRETEMQSTIDGLRGQLQTEKKLTETIDGLSQQLKTAEALKSACQALAEANRQKETAQLKMVVEACWFIARLGNLLATIAQGIRDIELTKATPEFSNVISKEIGEAVNKLKTFGQTYTVDSKSSSERCKIDPNDRRSLAKCLNSPLIIAELNKLADAWNTHNLNDAKDALRDLSSSLQGSWNRVTSLAQKGTDLGRSAGFQIGGVGSGGLVEGELAGPSTPIWRAPSVSFRVRLK